ncbi:MAG TPA: glycerol-3-phosphate responsive antiterminator [Clostridiaceae bacterium]|nr:glycerol-3-phosphate responsive antiterminator [Clostridiaceae bacterium]
MDRNLQEKILAESPVIPAIKDYQGLERCIESESNMVFILFGDICSISDIVTKVKNSGKYAIVHIDLIEGLSSKDVAVDFIVKYTKADGIISTKNNLIRYAKSKGLITIQRFFLIDSLAFSNLSKHASYEDADLIEILPGVMPNVISKVVRISKVPVIAGGLITEKEDIISALSAGATAVSTTNSKVWFL